METEMVVYNKPLSSTEEVTTQYSATAQILIITMEMVMEIMMETEMEMATETDKETEEVKIKIIC